MKKNQSVYFQEWYFKCQKNAQAIAFLPGISFDEKNQMTVFLQIITRIETFYLTFSENEFELDKNGQYLKIGNSIFTSEGMEFNLLKEDDFGKKIKLKGKISFGKLKPVKTRSFFCFLKPCTCKIISMGHKVSGTLHLNGRRLRFSNGTGFIQSVSGKEIPPDYFWTQYLSKEKGYPQIFTAVTGYASFGRQKVTGEAIIRYRKKTIIMAPYRSCRVLVVRPSLAILSQGEYLLLIHRCIKQGRELRAPVRGRMERIVHEELMGMIRYEFYKGGKKIFDLKTHRASIEYEQLKK